MDGIKGKYRAPIVSCAPSIAVSDRAVTLNVRGGRGGGR